MAFRINILFLFTLGCLCLLGIAALYSAGRGNIHPWGYRHIIIISGILILSPAIYLIDINFVYKHTYTIYIATLMILTIAEILGHTAMGAQRWLKIGPINIQPSEFMKLAVILALSRYFHDLHSGRIKSLRSLFIPLVITAIPVTLILRQPNLGTALLLFFTASGMIFAAGVNIKVFSYSILGALASLPILWRFLHPYQKARVMTFLSPENEPLGAGYNIIQSKIAIGSGGIWGKGMLEGSQSRLSFLPEKQTDFIFTLIAEEFGFIGVTSVLLAFIVLILCCYIIALRCVSQYSRLIAIGYACLLFLHIAINTAMISGLLPVVGIPLPFLSYGGSNLLSMLLGAILVHKASIHYNNTIHKNSILE